MLDYGSILAAGQNLVPDLRQDALAREEIDARRQETALRQQAFRAKLAEAEQEAAQRQAYNTRLEDFQRDPTPQKAAAMMLDFPDFADKFKAGWSVLDEQQRRTNLTQMSEIYYRANRGDYDGAAKKLETRIEADRAAGQDVADDEAILTALKSGDPQAQKEAAGLIALHTRAGDPEAFDKLFPQAKVERTDLEKKYAFLIETRGQAYAEQWLTEQTQDVVVGQPGAPVYRKSDIIGGSFASQPKGGDPTSTGEVTEFAMPVQGGTFTSGIGDARPGGRRHNGQDIAAPAGTPVVPIAPGTVVKVGSDKLSGNFVKVKHADGTVSSYSHLGSVGVKAGDPVEPGGSLGTVGATGNATGNVLHLVIRDRNGRAIDPRAALSGAGRKPIRSRQQYEKLPKGARYLAPDGKIRVKT